jgi:tryptophan halogenase
VLPPPAERAQLLLTWLLTQDIEGYEKSFKLSERTLLDQRFLVGIVAGHLSQARLLDVCRKLAMPRQFLEVLPAEHAAADTLHFGYEAGRDSAIFKLYFEYWRHLDPARRRGDESFVLHRAFKWDALNPVRHAAATYRCFPTLSSEQALARIAALHPGGSGHPVTALAATLTSLAAGRGGEPPMYLEVSEADNPRLSFDLNLHGAGLQLHAIESHIRALAGLYAVPPEQLQALWPGVAGKTLGHLAGGTGRDGKDFLTIYYDPLV